MNKDFKLFIQQQNEAIEKEILDTKKKFLLQILKRLTAHGRFVGSTPVDTGRAVTNWIMNEGSPSTSMKTKGFDKKLKGGEKATFSQGAMQKAMTKLDKLKPFEITYLSNNLPYINRIMNKGWSDQTPPNSIELTIAEVIQIMKQ